MVDAKIKPNVELTQLLDAILEGKRFSLDDLRGLASRSDLEKGIAKAVHELQHYIEDEDLRREDPEYEERWIERLRRVRDGL